MRGDKDDETSHGGEGLWGYYKDDVILVDHLFRKNLKQKYDGPFFLKGNSRKISKKIAVLF